MKRRLAAAFAALAMVAGAADLEADFLSPPQSCGPWAWWHWCGSNVSRAGITRDLEAMAAAGFGGATMFNIEAKGTPDPLANQLDPAFSYRNDEYWRCLEFAASEAKRLGLELGAHNCTGYSTAGGPWILPATAMKKVVWRKAPLAEGADPEKAAVARPEAVLGFYRDIGRAVANGFVYRFGYTCTGKRTHPAPPEMADKALEADKMSAAAMELHWDNVLAGFLAHVPPSRPGFAHILIDSYEAGPSDWTDDFREEFRRRRGYDPLPRLPALDGAFSAEENAAFKRDMDATVRELHRERYLDVSARRVRAAGYSFHLEPYWCDRFDQMEAAARCDVPMVEFWQGYTPWGEVVGATPWHCGPVGRAMGRTLLGCESFTATPSADCFSLTPRHLKRALDATFAAGINHLSLHDWVHQPLDAKYRPGFSMGFWGTHFGENQTWFEPGKAMFRYMQRCQALLQRGEQIADTLCVGGVTDMYADALSVYDACRFVEVVENGEVVVKPSGRRYRRIVPAVPKDSRTRELDEFLAGIAARGAAIGPKANPRVPPWEVLTKAGGEVRVVGRREGGTSFFFVANLSGRPAAPEIAFRVTGARPEIWRPADASMEISNITWRVTAETEPRTAVTVPLETDEAAFVVFRTPTSLTSGVAAATAPPDGARDVDGPWQVTFAAGLGAPETPQMFAKLMSWTDSAEEGVRYFSGTAEYVTTFELTAEAARKLKAIDLGEVRDIAEAELNGRTLGVAWFAPFRVNVRGAAVSGRNTLKVKVTNAWRNRLIGDRRLPEDAQWDAGARRLKDNRYTGRGLSALPEWVLRGEKSPTGRIAFTVWDYFTEESELDPAGLLGPVRLTF